MPISIDEFETDDFSSGLSLPQQVIAFLATNDQQAFTRMEIALALEEDRDAISTALTRLEDRSLVRHRDKYWAITEDSDRLNAAYDLHTITNALNHEDNGIDANKWDEAAPDIPHPSERGPNDSENRT